MTQQEPKKTSKDDLLDRLKSTPQAELTKGVKKVDHLGLEPSEEDRRKRGVRALNRETLATIRRAFYWFLFLLACLSIFVVIAGLAVLTTIWILTFVDDPMKLGDFLKDIGLGALIVLATITAERLFKSDDG